MKTIEINSRGLIQYCLVDDEDYPILIKHKWKVDKHNRVHRNQHPPNSRKSIRITMSRFIMGNPKGIIVDHKDGNVLNNTKENLRVCTSRQNSQNSRKHKNSKTSIYKGVSKRKDLRVWKAECRNETGKNIHLGYYKTEIEAALAYNNAAKKYHKEFANLNII